MTTINRQKTFRVRGLPNDVGLREAQSLLESALNNRTEVRIRSLALDPRHSEPVATVELDDLPPEMQESALGEWRYKTRVGGASMGQIELMFDTHFRGLVPLYTLIRDKPCVR